jgi:hypothetical protein
MPRKETEPTAADFAALAGMSDEAVMKATGRTWPEWVAALDAIGAAEMKHRDIARWVHDQTGLDWWSQSVTVGYERIRGLRDTGQRRGGAYEGSRSRTFAVPVGDLFAAFADEERRRRWLDAPLTIRKATPDRSLRITWDDGTDVQVYLSAKGPGKSAVQVQHCKLPSKEAAEAAKAYWAERLDALGRVLG